VHRENLRTEPKNKKFWFMMQGWVNWLLVALVLTVDTYFCCCVDIFLAFCPVFYCMNCLFEHIICFVALN
jgi:hypothetical protein